MLATPPADHVPPSHRKKRMRQLQKRVRSGSVDVDRDDPFDLFLAATSIRYCYYSETHKILGSTYGMCVLQVGRTPSHLHTLTPSHTLTHPLYGAPAHSHTLTPPHPAHILTHPLYGAPAHSHTLTPPHPHRPSHTRTHPHIPSLWCTHTLSHCHTSTPAYCHNVTPCHSVTPSHSHPHPHTVIMSHPHPVTVSHPHTLILSQYLTSTTLTPSHPHTVTPSHYHGIATRVYYSNLILTPLIAVFTPLIASRPHTLTPSHPLSCSLRQDFEALTPNLLARTVETVEGAGLVVVLLRGMTSLRQLYTLSMDVHARYRTEAQPDPVARFNERCQPSLPPSFPLSLPPSLLTHSLTPSLPPSLTYSLTPSLPPSLLRFLLSLAGCKSCLVMDDQLNILPLSSHASSIEPIPARTEVTGVRGEGERG